MARVAEEDAVSEQALVAAADALQSALGDHQARTVDGLVYEWRQGFSGDPLVERTPTRWVLCVPEHAWSDIVDRAGLDDSEAAAVRALHAAAADPDEQDSGVALVVDRE